MTLLTSLRHSLRALVAHRTRSLLAASGVAIGIAAVFLTTALGQGAQGELTSRLGNMGTRLLVVRPAQLKKTPARRKIQGFASSLKLDDYAAIAELPGLDTTAPLAEGAVKIETERGIVATQVLGTTSAFFRVRRFEIGGGRLFDDGEDIGAPRVAILGGRIKKALFPTADAVGSEIRIAGAAFEVVGTLVSKGMSADGADADNQVFIPVRAAMRRVFDSRSLSAIFVSVHHTQDLELAESTVRQLLRERHGLERRQSADDFTIQNQLRFLTAQQRVTRPLVLFSSGLAGLSLFVGGAGILALMLLSVQERRWEIGLRVAVGATSRDIFFQFLGEAAMLALLGGIAGIGIGALGTWGIAQVTHWAMRVSAQAVFVALGIASGIGIVFGAVPAQKAALWPAARALATE